MERWSNVTTVGIRAARVVISISRLHITSQACLLSIIKGVTAAPSPFTGGIGRASLITLPCDTSRVDGVRLETMSASARRPNRTFLVAPRSTGALGCMRSTFSLVTATIQTIA
jgi:hypothetical protein